MAESMTEAEIEVAAKIANHIIKWYGPSGLTMATEVMEELFGKIDCYRISERGLVLGGCPEGLAKRICVYSKLGNKSALLEAVREMKEQQLQREGK